MCVFFFFKQKTAYEMRISDGSSDVCSSDLGPRLLEPGYADGCAGPLAIGGSDLRVRGGRGGPNRGRPAEAHPSRSRGRVEAAAQRADPRARYGRRRAENRPAGRLDPMARRPDRKSVV